MDKVTRPSSPGGGSGGDASRLNRPPTGRTGASRRSSLRFGPNTLGPVAVKMQPRRAPDRPDGAPNCVTPVEQKGGDGLERRSPTGIARERETSADDAPNCITPVEQKGGDGLERRSPTGIARERETSADDAPNCVTPVEQKGGDGLERRPLVGIARERETSADDAGPCQRECRTTLFMRAGRAGRAGRTRSWPVLPVGAPPSPGLSAGRLPPAGRTAALGAHAT